MFFMAEYQLLLLGITMSYLLSLRQIQSTFTSSDVSTTSGNENARNNPIAEYLESSTFDKNCANGMGYATLSDCMRSCTRQSERFFPGKVETKEKSVDEEEERFEYKLVELSEGEFSVSPNKILTTRRLPIANFTQNSYTIGNGKARICYPLSQKFIACKVLLYLESQIDEFQLINESHKLKVILPDDKSYVLDVGEFYFVYDDAGIGHVAECQPQSERLEEETAVNVSFVVAYFISAVFLTFTFILSVTIPELNMRKNTVLLCHMVMLSAAYWTLVVNSLIGPMTINGCTAVAAVRQYTFLSSFLWINVQSIDLYIRLVNLSGQTSDHSSERRRFVYYAVYAWGIPSLFTVVTLVMAKSNAKILHPNFAMHCWFNISDKLTTFVYFYVIIILVLVSNIVLFGLLIFKLQTLSESVKNVNKNIHGQLLNLYLKLIVVMGLCWIMEVVSWAVGGDNRYWYFTDYVNSLQGLFIFLVYICKPSYMRTLSRKKPSWWPWKKNNQMPTSRDNLVADASKFRKTSNTTTTTDQSIPLQTMGKQSEQ